MMGKSSAKIDILQTETNVNSYIISANGNNNKKSISIGQYIVNVNHRNINQIKTTSSCSTVVWISELNWTKYGIKQKTTKTIEWRPKCYENVHHSSESRRKK